MRPTSFRLSLLVALVVVAFASAGILLIERGRLHETWNAARGHGKEGLLYVTSVHGDGNAVFTFGDFSSGDGSVHLQHVQLLDAEAAEGDGVTAWDESSPASRATRVYGALGETAGRQFAVLLGLPLVALVMSVLLAALVGRWTYRTHAASIDNTLGR